MKHGFYHREAMNICRHLAICGMARPAWLTFLSITDFASSPWQLCRPAIKTRSSKLLMVTWSFLFLWPGRNLGMCGGRVTAASLLYGNYCVFLSGCASCPNLQGNKKWLCALQRIVIKNNAHRLSRATAPLPRPPHNALPVRAAHARSLFLPRHT